VPAPGRQRRDSHHDRELRGILGHHVAGGVDAERREEEEGEDHEQRRSYPRGAQHDCKRPDAPQMERQGEQEERPGRRLLRAGEEHHDGIPGRPVVQAVEPPVSQVARHFEVERRVRLHDRRLRPVPHVRKEGGCKERCIREREPARQPQQATALGPRAVFVAHECGSFAPECPRRQGAAAYRDRVGPVSGRAGVAYAAQGRGRPAGPRAAAMRRAMDLRLGPEDARGPSVRGGAARRRAALPRGARILVASHQPQHEGRERGGRHMSPAGVACSSAGNLANPCPRRPSRVRPRDSIYSIGRRAHQVEALQNIQDAIKECLATVREIEVRA
jgi:hypothetical protein